MRITEATGPRAAGKLLAHIRALGVSIPDWCEKNGLDRLKVQRAIRGEIQRIDVGFAFEVRRATGGEVELDEWLPEGDSTESAE